MTMNKQCSNCKHARRFAKANRMIMYEEHVQRINSGLQRTLNPPVNGYRNTVLEDDYCSHFYALNEEAQQ